MYPDININININLPGAVAGAAKVAEDVSAIGPPPEEEGGIQTDSAYTEAAPPPDQAVTAEGATGFMPPGPDSPEGMSGLSSDGMSGEPPGPEAPDAPQMPDAEDKAAIKKPRAKGEKAGK